MNRELVPIYEKIADELKENINQGVYQAGEKLPTETQLSERFRVDRRTIRQAIALLKREGLIKVTQGRGTLITGKPIVYPITSRVRCNDAFIKQGFETSFQLLKAVEISAQEAIAKPLEISPGEPVAWIERLMFANSHPICMASSYFPLRYFPNFLAHEARMWSLSRLLREVYGCDHLRRQTSITARLIDVNDDQLLRLQPSDIILVLKSINVDQNGRVIEYGIARFPGDQIEVIFKNESS